MATVAFENVGKIFADGTQALRDFSLEVADGELMVLVGPSGCGKSTLLRLLAGLEQPSGGEILINGERVNDLPPQARKLAMVFQNYALYPHMTVAGNLGFPLRMAGLARAESESRVLVVAELLGLTTLMQRFPRQLSGGQRQRVAMGRALVRQPQVFLLDEPLSNLDALLRVEIRAEIARLQQRTATTTLYVTHDQVEAMSLGQRVAVMRAGRLEQLATPQELYTSPATAFVASFIGNPGMNLFRSEVDLQAEGNRCRFGSAWLSLPPGEWPTDIMVGIRPDAFTITAIAGDGITVQVSHVERLGHEQLVYFDADINMLSADRLATGDGGSCPGGLLVARLPATTVVMPGALELSVQPDAIALFDANGRALHY